ncbi:phytase [Stenotrophomonas panacihumi]|uniref:Phytase n=2 Tax=Stenotrophomonas panacihumi TaxID=676599 RepID=A0A0R0ANZ9_9GAMM|nr:phytase [Stenotrophomonas panacihumi]PTN55130.1 phytase [Stenotrophomonas panacihumi]
MLALAGLLSACASNPTAAPSSVKADREPDEQGGEPLLSKAHVPHVVISETFLTPAAPADNLDSPAAWRAPDGRRWIITTAKGSHQLVVFDGDSGVRLRGVGGKGTALGQLDRPNGISVVDDLAFVVERDNRRVQVFSLPAFEPLAVFGSEVLREPYGLWVRPLDRGYEVIVSDNYMSPANKDVPPPLAELGQRFKRFRFAREGGQWQGKATGSFGDTGEQGAVRIAESVYGDVANDRLMIAEEDTAVGTQLREYGLDGRYKGRNIGARQFQAQAEGMTLMQCADGSGYWIATDQFKDRSLFHVFDRRSLAHVGAFSGRITANTDGVWLDPSGDARFPQGVFYALHDDQAVAAFDWRDIAKALRLKECAK